MAETPEKMHAQIAHYQREGYETRKHMLEGCIFRGPYKGKGGSPALFKLVTWMPAPGPGIWMEGLNIDRSPCISERAIGRTFRHLDSCPCWDLSSSEN